MRVLFYTDISPFPVNGGEKIRSFGLIKALSKLNYNVTAVIQNEEKIDLSHYHLPNVKYIEFSDNCYKSFFDRVFLTRFIKKNKQVIEIFKSLLKKDKLDLVILDYGVAGKYSKYFKKRGIPFIIGTHNVETDLYKQRPVSSFYGLIRKWQECFYMTLHEKHYYPMANGIISVSPEDTLFYTSVLSLPVVYTIPNFLDESRYNVDRVKGNHLVMTANFYAYMNKQGLKWFVDEVWNKELDDQIHVKLVGRYSKEAYAALCKKYKNIEAVGEVEDVIPYIAESKGVIIPLLHGSGTRLKCLEAMALRTVIISTSKGCEGIQSKNIIIADEVNEFRNALKKINSFEVDTEMLYDEFLGNYSLHSNLPRIKRMTEEVVAQK